MGTERSQLNQGCGGAIAVSVKEITRLQLPNATQAYIPPNQLKGYLLSETHTVGKAKAKFFRGLGFHETNVDALEHLASTQAIRGDPGNPNVMAAVIQELIDGFNFPVTYQLHLNASLDDAKTWLEEGDFLITQGWFTTEGHVICLTGLQTDTEDKSYSFLVRDPWSKFDPSIWNYSSPSPRWVRHDGYYSSYCIYAACVAGTSSENAASIYNNHELDSSLNKMWAHRFMPNSNTKPSRIYLVHKGDTLSGIAEQLGIPLGALEAANPQITNPNQIYPNERLKIPEA